MSTGTSHSAAAMQAAAKIVKGGGRLTVVTPDGEILESPAEPLPSSKSITPPAELFFDDEIEFMVADELRTRADELIKRYPEISFLSSVSITYLWKGKGGTKGGKARLGACQKPSGLLKFLSDGEFIIWLAADHCRGGDGSPALTEEQIEALLYHEMCHIGWDDDKDCAIVVGHDLEEFRQVVERYGLWADDTRMMEHTFRQLRIDA